MRWIFIIALVIPLGILNAHEMKNEGNVRAVKQKEETPKPENAIHNNLVSDMDWYKVQIHWLSIQLRDKTKITQFVQGEICGTIRTMIEHAENAINSSRYYYKIVKPRPKYDGNHSSDGFYEDLTITPGTIKRSLLRIMGACAEDKRDLLVPQIEYYLPFLTKDLERWLHAMKQAVAASKGEKVRPFVVILK